MKKVFLAMMAIAAFAMVSCKPGPEPEPQPSPEPTPQPTTESSTVYYLSDYIADIVRYSYYDNNGESKILTKEDWVAIDKSDPKEKPFLDNLAELCKIKEMELTDEMVSHIKKFVISNQPNMIKMIRVTNVPRATMPTTGTVILIGHSHSYGSTVTHVIETYNAKEGDTDEQKREAVLDIAKQIDPSL